MPKSAVRVLDIFELLAECPQGLTFTEIRERLRIPKSSLNALLKVVSSRGYIVPDGENRYMPGVKLIELSKVEVGARDLVELADRTMRVMRDLTLETVNLATRDKGDIVFIHKKLAPSPLRYDSPVGMRLPAYVTATGKAILATLSDEQVEELYPRKVLVGFAPGSLRTLDELHADLQMARRRGFATDHEEGLVGVCAVACPIQNASRNAVAGISIAFPKARASDEAERKFSEMVIAGAQIISAKLGYHIGSELLTNDSLREIWAGK
jgi:IclR family transcriptional regulator, KDG regulon repressor